jgi:hypothetical protein
MTAPQRFNHRMYRVSAPAGSTAVPEARLAHSSKKQTQATANLRSVAATPTSPEKDTAPGPAPSLLESLVAARLLVVQQVLKQTKYFPDAVADVDSPSAAVADSSAGYSAACDPSDDAPVPITLGVNIGGIQQVTGLPEYINTVYRYLVSIILVVAIVMVVYGGFLYLTGAAGIGSIQRGKQIIRDALIGMVVVLAAYSILQTINPSTTQFRLNPESIECVGISASSTARDPNADEGGAIPACVRDSQCREGRVCLRTSNTEGLSSGQCTQGRANELCRCSGGCDVRTSEDGSPTNNNGTMQVACQEGTCQQIEGLWRCLTGETGSVCNMAADPQIPCAAGFTCQQGNEEQVGRCVTGDYRDYELDPRPVCSKLVLWSRRG